MSPPMPNVMYSPPLFGISGGSISIADESGMMAEPGLCAASLRQQRASGKKTNALAHRRHLPTRLAHIDVQLRVCLHGYADNFRKKKR